MQKWVLLVLIFVAFYFGTLFVSGQGFLGADKQASPTATVSARAPIEKSVGQTQGVTIKPPAVPLALTVPGIGINSVVEQVGLDSEDRMDVPKDVDNVGWFSLGVRPGEKGNAVMAGHFDRESGAPAVFYRLNELTLGDEVRVKDEDNNEYIYKVAEIRTYPFNQVPLDYVFGSSEKSRLNLITCSGTWDRGSSNYTTRTVVYTELIP